MAVLTLTISDNVLAELQAYADRRNLTLPLAGAYALSFGLVRLALVDREPDPDATLDDTLDALVAA